MQGLGRKVLGQVSSVQGCKALDAKKKPVMRRNSSVSDIGDVCDTRGC